MNELELNKNISHGAKWSISAELIAKIISPIINLILARLLVPEIFGIIATISIIISFAEMLADAGFQKFIIQYEFKNDVEKSEYINVAFWTNLGLSLCMFFIIALFQNQIAYLLGVPNLGFALMIAAVQIPLHGFASIQLAVFRREFKFKKFFIIRVLTATVPLFVTIPLAYLGFGYWSLIIGTITGLVLASILYFIFSTWKPLLVYNISILKKMLSFVSWTLIESLLIWLTNWIDTIILVVLITDAYYMGLYKNSVVSVSGILGIITTALMPVFFSGLSRLQNNNDAFYRLFYMLQKFMAYILIPLGAGIFIYRDLITNILLGSSWSEGALIIGLWGSISVFVILLSNLNSEVFRSKGKPKLSSLVQFLHLVVLIPVIIISAQDGFWTFIYARSFIRVQIIIVSLFVFKIFFKQPISKTIKNILKPILFVVPMIIFIYFTNDLIESVYYNILIIITSMILYFGMVLLFAKADMIEMINFIKSKIIDENDGLKDVNLE